MDTNAFIRFQQELTIFVDTWNRNNHTQFKFNTADLLSYFLQSRQAITISPPPVVYSNNSLTEHGISRIICSPQQNNVSQPISPVSPITPSQNRSPTFDIHLATITEEKESQFLNASAAEFVPTPSPPSSPMVSPNAIPKQSHRSRTKCKQLFRPQYPSRAQLNIFIAKELTAQLLNNVREDFPSTETLYYYIDISTALQINDGQMHIFSVNNAQIVFVNYDLHSRDNGDILYGVIGLNKGHRIRQNKWIWKLYSFMTANEIYERYCVGYNELPLSSRRMNKFQKQLEIECGLSKDISVDVIGCTDWSNIQQIKSLKRNGNGTRVQQRGWNKRSKMAIVLKIGKEVWMEECVKSWSKYPAIPIVVNENKNGNYKRNTHWIEWVKLIQINGNQLFGVSCKYVSHKEQWAITSINLDKGDILNKHRLIGYESNKCQKKYIQILSSFNTQFTEVQWSKSH